MVESKHILSNVNSFLNLFLILFNKVSESGLDASPHPSKVFHKLSTICPHDKVAGGRMTVWQGGCTTSPRKLSYRKT